MMIAGPQAGAQQFSLSVTASDTAILASNSVTYTITITNLGADLTNTFVTNFFSTSGLPETNLSYSSTYSQGTNYPVANGVVFKLGTFFAVQPAQLTLTVTPTVAGYLTNSITVIYPPEPTNAVSTNVVVQVTNTVPPVADLGVTMTGPKQVVITNDWMTYGVTITNAGPDDATGVMLTNIVPAGVIGISLPKQNSGTNSPISLGTLVNGGSMNLFFTVEPTNIATLPFFASVGSGTRDTNTANNFASTNITVTNYLPGLLVVVTNSPQTINFQNALTEQSITLSNAGLSSIPAARIIVTAVTNRLFNAVGTNNGNPFVYYSARLAVGQSANLLLQYYPRGYFPFTNSQLSAFAVPLPDWTPPAATPGTNVISRIVQLSNGNILIEWPSVTDRTYTVVYSDNVSFSNAMIAPPAIVAPANRTQWIDYGPPTTVSAPPNSTNRFYRVYQNP